MVVVGGAKFTCNVAAAAEVHALKLVPCYAAVAVFVHFPHNFLGCCLVVATSSCCIHAAYLCCTLLNRYPNRCST